MDTLKKEENNVKSICPLCERQNVQRKYGLPQYSIFSCPRCRVEYNANFPPKSSVEESFSEHYYTELQKEAFTDQENDYTRDPSYEYYRKGLRYLGGFTEGRKLLDVGAGVGAFLKTANDDGWNVEGVEISRYGSEFIRAKYGFTIYSDNLMSLGLEHEKYNVITFWDSIEHMEFPKRQLEETLKLLKKEGILLLTSDNYSSLISFLCRAMYSLSCGKITYPMERFFIPYNKTYFTHESMRALLQETGYEVVFFEKIQYPINKLKLGYLENIILKVLYKAESYLKAQSQFMFIARKAVD